MPEVRKWVLIGDPSLERFELLRKILDDGFLMNAGHAKTYEELRNEYKKRKWRLVLVAHNLPQTEARNTAFLVDYFAHLNIEAADVAKGCIIGKSEQDELERIDPQPHRVHIPSAKPSAVQRERIVTELGSILPRARHLPDIRAAKTPSLPSLREQIRLLSEHRSFRAGKEELSHLLRDLFDWERIEVDRLGQGASGAKVFLVRPILKADPRKKFILKLCSVADFWKIKLEIERHESAKKTLGDEEPKKHFAQLVEAIFPYELEDRGVEKLVYHGNWFAICYEFLGGERLGTFIDLETALVGNAATLEKKTKDTPFPTAAADAAAIRRLRFRLFETALTWLSQNWYMKPSLTSREERKLWETQDTPHEQYPQMPPYRFAGNTKGFILNFLDSRLAEIGLGFFDDWEAHRERVWHLVDREKGKTGTAFLDRKLSVAISPAHGDLNSNNLLMWLDQSGYPFLIDFPFYQEKGHALQDFARLEVEIKFALMDRQGDGVKNDLIALDYTYSQLHLWKEMEDHLLSAKWAQSKATWLRAGYTDNVAFCLELVQKLRWKARDVQRQGAVTPIPDFMEEYLPALLYHTVRAIGYNSLSIFKRLLAVYSSGVMLAK